MPSLTPLRAVAHQQRSRRGWTLIRALLSARTSTPPTPPVGASASPIPAAHSAKPLTTLQEANPRNQPELWFKPSFPRKDGEGWSPDDERKLRLGKTLRILQERLPTLLQSPLPQNILSPNISLHLFPSTHPHLPVVSGRVAYIAALWTSPIAWNRVPVVGNVRLEVLSERMVRRNRPTSQWMGSVCEQLVVRWRTVGSKGRSWTSLLTFLGNGNGAEYKAPVGAAQAVDEGKEFTGLFIFDFDREGRILSHTIEHVEEGGCWEKGVGAKVVGLTDWLLGGIRGGTAPCPAFAGARKPS